MSEHKLREAGNGDGDKSKLSSHIVEVVREYADNVPSLAEGIEAAYTRIAERAERENSLIVGVVQSVTSYTILEMPDNYFRAYVLVTLSAQRISREDFERQQRMAQFSGGPRR